MLLDTNLSIVWVSAKELRSLATLFTETAEALVIATVPTEITVIAERAPAMILVLILLLVFFMINSPLLIVFRGFSVSPLCCDYSIADTLQQLNNKNQAILKLFKILFENFKNNQLFFNQKTGSQKWLPQTVEKLSKLSLQ